MRAYINQNGAQGVPTYKYYRRFTYNSNDTFIVPSGIEQLIVDCAGGQGFTSSSSAVGGYGGRVQCLLNVTEGQTLKIKVGAQNTAYNSSNNASAIYTGSNWTSGYLIIAGGGGGAARTDYLQIRAYNGGAGGGLTAGTGGSANNATVGYGGGGGTQSAGGSRAYFSMYLKSLYATAGSQFTGGACNSERHLSGYGGQGYFGGGGAVEGYYQGGSSEYGASCAAAGGGSSYTNSSVCTNVSHTLGHRSGNGYVTLSYEVSEHDEYDYRETFINLVR